MAIPKIIHYVWVGPNKKTELVERCIESWRRYAPDYQLVEWNNEKFMATDNAYARQAFAAGKWAFVSDYLRLYALASQGGFYLDTDLELTGSLELFRQHRFVTGFERFKNRYAPVTALMGAEAANPIITELLQMYQHRSFTRNDGSLDLTPNTGLIAEYFAQRFGLQAPYQGAGQVQLEPGAVIYPSHYFCTPEAGLPNYSIHHFNGSWFPEYERRPLLRMTGYQLALLKRNKVRSGQLPLLQGEHLIGCLRLFKRYSLMLASYQS